MESWDVYLHKLPSAIVLVPLFRWWLSMRYGCVERIFRCRTLLRTEKIWINLTNNRSAFVKRGPGLFQSIVFVLLFGIYHGDSTIIEPGLGACVMSGHPYVYLALARLAWRLTTWTELYPDRDSCAGARVGRKIRSGREKWAPVTITLRSELTLNQAFALRSKDVHSSWRTPESKL